MGFQISHKVKENQLKPGDHIYAWRPGFLYAHHGIFLRTDKVIQLAPAAKGIDHREQKPARCGHPKCGFRAANGSAVVRSCLSCFLRGGVPRLHHYGVPTVEYLLKTAGTCSTAKREADLSVVVHRAKYLLKNGFGEYNLYMNNCEDFALYCSTGLVVRRATADGILRSGRTSGQVKTPIYYRTPTGMIKRYFADIGVRKDVVKVTVEQLVANISHGTPSASQGGSSFLNLSKIS
ncbi:hypothetical protein Dimus_029783 [Dionaea muscipula]